MQWTVPIQRHRNDGSWLIADVLRSEQERPELKHERTLRHGPNAMPETKTVEAEA